MTFDNPDTMYIIEYDDYEQEKQVKEVLKEVGIVKEYNFYPSGYARFKNKRFGGYGTKDIILYQCHGNYKLIHINDINLSRVPEELFRI